MKEHQETELVKITKYSNIFLVMNPKLYDDEINEMCTSANSRFLEEI